MPLDPADLRRGAIVYAIYPFAADFPVKILKAGKLTAIESVEQFARLRGGQATRLVTEVRLRPILLLHEGTRGEHQDVICLRINTVKPTHRRHERAWRQIESHEHPFFFHLPPDEPRYGLREESVIALASLGTINKGAILGPRSVGHLTRHEMQIISQRLARLLSLDLAPQIASRAQELLRRAGLLRES